MMLSKSNTHCYFLTGFSWKTISKWESFREAWAAQQEAEVPSRPGTKKFTPKCNLPKLNSYRGEAGSDYWAEWPRISWEEAKLMRSAIDPIIFERLARESNYPYPSILGEVIRDIRIGAMIGVPEQYRVQSSSTNAPSAFDFGDRVSDSLCKMMRDGYIMGPFAENSLPFGQSRVSGLMVKLKPDGSARMILNLSKGDPVSVNEGINSADYPAIMSSTHEFVRVLNRSGHFRCTGPC